MRLLKVSLYASGSGRRILDGEVAEFSGGRVAYLFADGSGGFEDSLSALRSRFPGLEVVW